MPSENGGGSACTSFSCPPDGLAAGGAARTSAAWAESPGKARATRSGRQGIDRDMGDPPRPTRYPLRHLPPIDADQPHGGSASLAARSLCTLCWPFGSPLRLEPPPEKHRRGMPRDRRRTSTSSTRARAASRTASARLQPGPGARGWMRSACNHPGSGGVSREPRTPSLACLTHVPGIPVPARRSRAARALLSTNLMAKAAQPEAFPTRDGPLQEERLRVAGAFAALLIAALVLAGGLIWREHARSEATAAPASRDHGHRPVGVGQRRPAPRQPASAGGSSRVAGPALPPRRVTATMTRSTPIPATVSRTSTSTAPRTPRPRTSLPRPSSQVT